MPNLTEIIKEYPPNTAIIRYKMPDGSIVDWAISARARFDSEWSLREHLRKWIPEAKFVDCIIGGDENA